MLQIFGFGGRKNGADEFRSLQRHERKRATKHIEDLDLELPAPSIRRKQRTALFSLRKEDDFDDIQLPRKFMDNIQRASPELRFDLEKKIKFASCFRREVDDYLRANGGANVGLQPVGQFLNFCSDILYDHEHVLTGNDYDRHKPLLTNLPIGARRKIENFYSDFFVAVRGLQRVLFFRWPELSEMEEDDLDAIYAALNEVKAQIADLGKALDDFISR